ncbi:lysozyme [Streptomyces sp.]|uniref:lysozyme n=1 Tax=Streptomyces sp. TaxID=1931 RepID=UPI002F3E8251
MNIAGHGPRHRSILRRSLTGVGGTLIAVIALLVTVPSGATASTPAPTPDEYGRITHPERDWMGSTVAAHEGRSTAAGGGAVTASVTQTPGFDASHWQGTVNWAAAYSNGARFAYIKATEGTTYRDPNFSANYTNSYNAGYIRGAYHFATPNTSSGVAQADWFVAHGGGWSKDGKTLPPMLDIEYNPYGATCYGLSKAAMRSWLSAFINEVHAKTTRWATIYTTTDWWTTCTGNTSMFAATNPLFIARYASSPGTLPAGWPFHTFWQYADSGVFPGDQDKFNGAYTRLQNLANNT